MNNKYLKIIFSALIVFGLFLLFAPVTFAQSDFGLTTAGKVSGLSGNALSRSGDIPSILGYLVSIVLSLSGIFFFLLILYAGFIWMTAAGSMEKVQSAKSKMISAVIGLAIVLSAYALTSFIFDSFIQVGSSKCEPACPDTQVCVSDNTCEDKCTIVFKQYGGECKNVSECDGRILGGYCGGELDNKCCVPIDQYKSYESELERELSGDTIDFGVPLPEKSACEKAGNFCVNESSCLTVHNGTVSGEGGCAKGDVCCKNCKQSKGGTCVKQEASCVPGDAVVSGYCFGSFEGQFCCTGKVLE